MTEALIPVTAAPVFDASAGRADLMMPAGATIAEIVATILPDLPPEDWTELRVVLVTPLGITPIDQALWHRVRPNPGVHTLIRIRPGGSETLANILITVISVAAIAVGGPLAAAIIPQAGLLQTLVQGLITAGITIAGSMLVRALIPPPTTDDGERRATYAISGWRNEFRPDQPVPLPLGKHRFAPFFAAGSYTEIEGDNQYVRALFTFGYGRLDISDIRIGDTPISEYDEVEIEVREGLATDDPVSLYPRQVLEDATGVELVRPLPRDEAGEVITAEPAIETPVVRFTAADATQASVIISFSSGLFRVNDDGDIRGRAVEIRIRQRIEGGSVWATVNTLRIWAKSRQALHRQYTWTLPSRGRWEIELTRMTDETTDTKTSDRSHFAALQSIRPEYPLNFDKPLALLALRVKATNQLSGTLDNVNALVQRYGPIWDGVSWSTGLTRSPASAYLTLLQSSASPYPVADTGIDLDLIADWYEFCATKGLKYDRIHAADETLAEALTIACAAGRAAPRHDGIAWGVVIDRPDTLVVDHINPRSRTSLSRSRSYFDPPDAFRIPFHDQTNDYERAERIVPWPGHTGDILLTETLELPGKTDPAEIWTEARRRMYELLHRPDTFTAIQDGQARVPTRGDLVMGSFDFLSRTQIAARVKSIYGALVELDETVEMETGTDYAIRFRVFAGGGDAIGTSVVRQVVTVAGTTQTVRLLDPDAMPEAGDLVHFGPLASESLALKVKGVEPGENFSSVLRMVAAAPVIDDLTDADTPPAWSGRVGADVEIAAVAPGVPYFIAIEHGVIATGDPDGLNVVFAPGSGAQPTVSVRVEHKLYGAGSYSGITVPVANGGADIGGYSADDVVVLRLVGITADATESVPSTAVVIQIGADDPPVPAALAEGSIVTTGALGYAQIAFATGSDLALARVHVYRVPTGGTLDREVHAVGSPIPVTPSSTFTYVDGDATRANLITDGGFANAASWTLDANWSIAADKATHATGVGDAIKQAISLSAGADYRGRVVISGLTAGSLTPTLFGGIAQTDAALVANGTAYFDLEAVSGNTDFGFTASSDCDASIDAVVVFHVTPACVPQGTFDYYLEPQNEVGGAGPVTSALTVTVI